MNKTETSSLPAGMMQEQTEYLSMDNVSVGYHKRALIHDISLTIKRGEIVTLIGPNGAGKSTILKSLSKQLELIRGRVTIPEYDLDAITYQELSKKMAVVLTDRIRAEYMTCYDVVASGRYPYTGRFGVLSHEDEDKVEAALAIVNATELGTREFSQTSDGQKQRVLLARVLCQEPEIILLDEPTSFLDVHYKLDLLSVLRRMAKEQGITVLMSLHEIDLAEKVSDKIICVKGDTIAHYGAPDEIFKEEIIRDLYEVGNGSYDPAFGSLELSAVKGAPQVFVISSGGSGLKTFRNLQKQQIPFACGILYKNDIDYQLARLLASEVVTETPFEPISDAAFERAGELIDQCENVILCDIVIGQTNARMQELIDYAKGQDKIRLKQSAE